MKKDSKQRDLLLVELKETVSEAVSFFSQVDSELYDGYQTAYQVLAHLVFWHRAYCNITQSLLLGTSPKLLKGSLDELNQEAAEEFDGKSMQELADCLQDYQKVFANNLRQMEDWEVNFPFKAGCRRAEVAKRIRYIINHIHNHLIRQKRAYERGEAWVEAYYP